MMISKSSSIPPPSTKACFFELIRVRYFLLKVAISASNDFLKNQELVLEENLQKKQLILEQMKSLNEEQANSHSAMQRQINKMEGLRTSFF